MYEKSVQIGIRNGKLYNANCLLKNQSMAPPTFDYC